jgi:hypothetical protein
MNATDPLVRTFLPLYTWMLQKIFGPVLERDAWKEVAQSVVPPPKYMVDLITREFADMDSPALLSAVARRRFRKQKQYDQRGQLRNNSMVSVVREYCLDLREKMEAKGFRGAPGRIRKWKDLEAETNDYYSRLAEHPELPESLGPISSDKAREIVALLWELAVYGRYKSDTKPKITRSSMIFKALGIDSDKLMAMNEMNDKDGLLMCLSLFEAPLGLRGQPPEENKLLQLLRWAIRTYLPSDQEGKTTPEALSKATIAGLIHKPIVIKDKETGKVVEMDIEDTSALQVGELSEADGREAIIEAFAHKGIGYNDLTPNEWQEIFERRDLIRKGLEFSSKTGVSISSFYGKAAHAKEQKWSRIKKKIRELSQ